MFNDFLNASSKEDVGGIKAYGDYDHKLDYQVEYILSGLKSDKANLSGVALKISLVREGINFSYALLNKEKRAAAMKLATSLAGASGNVGLVKAVQITILALWAYAEGLYDVRRLVKGEELPAIKNDDDWKLDLDGIFDLAFDEIEGRLIGKMMAKAQVSMKNLIQEKRSLKMLLKDMPMEKLIILII